MWASPNVSAYLHVDSTDYIVQYMLHGLNPELVVPKSLQVAFPGFSGYFQTIEDHFIVRGPNGSHLILISPLAGPSFLAMSDSPGRVSGSRRLRGDLARKVAKETAKAVYCMHRAGWVHGGKLSSFTFLWVTDE